MRASARSDRGASALARALTGSAAPACPRSVFGTPSRPRSCTSAARRSCVASASTMPYEDDAACARAATPLEWPIVYGDLTSTKSATASSATSSSRAGEPVSRRGFGGHHRLPWPNRVELCEQRVGGGGEDLDQLGVKLRARTLSRDRHGRRHAAGRWNTSTTSARLTSRDGDQDLLTFEPLGDAAPVPPLKALLHGVAHERVEPDPLPSARRRRASGSRASIRRRAGPRRGTTASCPRAGAAAARRRGDAS